MIDVSGMDFLHFTQLWVKVCICLPAQTSKLRAKVRFCSNFLDSAAKQDISANTKNRADFDYAGNKDFIVKFSIQYWVFENPF